MLQCYSQYSVPLCLVYKRINYADLLNIIMFQNFSCPTTYIVYFSYTQMCFVINLVLYFLRMV